MWLVCCPVLCPWPCLYFVVRVRAPLYGSLLDSVDVCVDEHTTQTEMAVVAFARRTFRIRICASLCLAVPVRCVPVRCVRVVWRVPCVAHCASCVLCYSGPDPAPPTTLSRVAPTPAYHAPEGDLQCARASCGVCGVAAAGGPGQIGNRVSRGE